MITISNLAKIYSGKIVADVPALHISTGEIVGLVGNNGAGKTTLFRLILDLIRADRGEVILKEDWVVSKTEDWKNFTASYLDEGFLIGYLTPEEYFYFIGGLSNMSKTEVDETIKKFEPFFEGNILNSGKYLRDLSKGNQFKAGIAGCLLQKPELLILDEPFANLDPSSQMRLINMLKEEQQNNRTTIFISSHDLNHITEACDRILLMEKGRIIKDLYNTDDTLKELKSYFQV